MLDTTAFRVVVGRALLWFLLAGGSMRVWRTLVMRRERMRRRLVPRGGLVPYPALVSGGGQLRAPVAVEGVEEWRERQAVNGHEQAELTQIPAIVSAQHGKALLPLAALDSAFQGLEANGSEKRGSVRNSVSVSDSRKAMTSCFSWGVRVKPRTNSL